MNPALYRVARRVRGVRTQGGRHVALLPGLPGAQRHHALAAFGGTAPQAHVDQLVDETRGARFFTKLDLASAYHQFRFQAGDQ